LLRIWQDVLAVEAIGLEDNFFDVGGSSFTLATVHSRLAELLGRPLSLVTLYEHPTVSALAEHLAGAGGPTDQAAMREPAAQDRRAAGAAAHDRLHAGRARLARRRNLQP
jgi:hypothetical protein